MVVPCFVAVRVVRLAVRQVGLKSRHFFPQGPKAVKTFVVAGQGAIFRTLPVVGYPPLFGFQIFQPLGGKAPDPRHPPL